MWYFIGGTLVGVATGFIVAGLMFNAKQLDKELEEAVRNWSKDIEI